MSSVAARVDKRLVQESVLILVYAVHEVPEMFLSLFTRAFGILRARLRHAGQDREVEKDHPHQPVFDIRLTYLGNRAAVPGPAVPSGEV